eukprot:scaffold3774_cov126-Cylindrotheca_fusiformis.AAC.1
MQEEAGFLFYNEEGGWHCERDANTYNGLICPEGHYKVSEEHFAIQCEEAGLNCSEGHTCYCRPCVKAHEVDVFPWNEDYRRTPLLADHERCDKMSLCGAVEQGEEITFHAYDNLARSGISIEAVVHHGQELQSLPVDHSEAEFFEYNFTFSHNRKGVAILEVFVDGIQIPESPFRIEVVEKKCQHRFMVAVRTLVFPVIPVFQFLIYFDTMFFSTAHQSDVGVCECSTEGILLFGECISKNLFIGVVAILCAGILLLIAIFYQRYRRQKQDEMWQVNTEELHFSHPVEVIGQGGFGLVLLAEYRGTKVAIKRVLPLLDKTKGKRSGSAVSLSRKDNPDNTDEEMNDEISRDVESGSIGVGATTKSLSESDRIFGFIDSLSFGRKGLKRWIPFLRHNEAMAQSLSILGTVSGGSSTKRGFLAAFSCCDETTRRREEFKEEMRLLSRLRHPCITTVMGAVMNGYEPMMVMEYMENGSLHDLLRNETLYTGGEMILQIVRDVSQGLRFLHASKPPILHGDLKAKNILIDSRFRAKVGDFGLALKNKRGLAGTPYWYALV